VELIPEWLQREVDDYFVVSIETAPTTVLDIGANIGAFALRAHQEWPNAKVFCYEPMPFNVVRLRQNVDQEWCTVEPSAVRAKAGTSDIFIGDMFVTGGFARGARQTDQTVRVNCVAVSSLPACDLVKIDTEGSEVEILQSLDLRNTKVIMLEHHCTRDAELIKEMLSGKFQLVHDETWREIGTEVFFAASGKDNGL
jgi:FkbM family methyltransferase